MAKHEQMPSELKFFNLSLSERCRALADECRSKARSFRNDKPRTQMPQLAADYERKARLAEVWKRRCEIDLIDTDDTESSKAFAEQVKHTK